MSGADASATAHRMSASLIGRFGSSAFHQYSVDVTHGLVLLFGLGARGASSLGFENEAEQSLGRLSSDGRSERTYELTSSIVPRGTSFHRAVELECSPS